MTDPSGELDGQASERGVLPVITRPRAGPSVVVLILCMIAAAILLFVTLDARRRSLSAPATLVREVDASSLPSALPPLAVPPEPMPPPVETAAPLVAPPPQPPMPPPPPLPPPSALASPYVAPQLSQPPSSPPVGTARLPGSGGPVLAVDTSGPRAATDGAGSAASSGATSGPSDANVTVGGTERVRASMMAGRATTVPQGTLIPAVLETAFNSARAGFARAIVARNVVGFDGTRILIARGSRLIGQYQSDATPGQKRALIVWTRLIRADGATITIGSPTADPVGQGGVRAQVDSHFLERFSGAILQSALNVGVNLASRAANGAVILALPNAIQSGSGSLAPQTSIPPTLTVRAGTSISIFVARDLDFTDVERGR